MEVSWIGARAKEHFQILMNGWSMIYHRYDSNGLGKGNVDTQGMTRKSKNNP